MKTKTTVTVTFEIGDTFLTEDGSALVVRQVIATLYDKYLAFHTNDDIHLKSSYVEDLLDAGRWTYLGKVVMEADV